MSNVNKPSMLIDDAIDYLSSAARNECKDRAFGDSEVYWMIDNKMVAEGYFGYSDSYVVIDATGHHAATRFNGEQANKFRSIGIDGAVEFNDAGIFR